MKSPADSSWREPTPVRPALLVGLALASLLTVSGAALWTPPSHLGTGPATVSAPAEAPSAANLIGALEGLPSVQR